ncbi:hypothetical protein OB2597_01722 [Pseudooceanicola batsensis HTCC2597]|uniref:Uncharacterized protein n=1 Tax=Pseudooceanicola batsensis (strain ATCC BAA-863 / DSM 15984 / KCTC 12145 / HTCC2597) TaxID=252305 RepID=A3TWT8_PSEBH|nr:hypothetical protein [Pseudooceanicola batsensis]EAQ03298.1 hypothetical protein OB2597_01722 [Pseudooceanicola batsensis HTCC2597]
MFKKTVTAAGLALFAATPVFAVEGPFAVKEVDADTYFEAMENPNALDYYPNIAEDIESAVRARADMADDEDYRPINIDIVVTALRLNDSPVLTDEGEFNILEGIVNIRDTAETEADPVISEPVVLRAEEAAVSYPAFSPDNNAFYNAMVAAFAERAVALAESVDTLPDEGEVRN